MSYEIAPVTLEFTMAPIPTDLLFPAVPDKPTPRLNLGDVIAHHKVAPDISPRQRRERISALRTIARAFDGSPAAIPAEVRYLRERMAAVLPANHGISQGRFNNIRSLAMAALRQCDVPVLRGRAGRPLGPAWHALRALLRVQDEKTWLGLSRFMSYCDAREIAPCAVAVSTFDSFHLGLINDSLAREPNTIDRGTRAAWNLAARTIAGWPDLIVPVPDIRRRYALGWPDFPESFRVDAEAFLYRGANPDLFSDAYAKPLKKSTVEMRRRQILQIATALLRSGRPASTITDLATLALVPNATAALRYFGERPGGKLTTYTHQYALLLKTIARHWTGASADEIGDLSKICRRLAVKKTGMTDKKRERPRQFDNQDNVAALVHLPARVRREVRAQDTIGPEDDARVMFALAVDLLLVAPIRVDNLAGLDIRRHLVSVRRGAGTTHLVIPAHETKTGKPYELELPRPVAAAVAHYRANHYVRLSSGPSDWLFPRAGGERWPTGYFATQIIDFVRAETGLVMNVHLFHHLAAKFYLEAHPDDIGTVRRLLGHTNVATTLRYYAEIKTAAAFRRYDSVIADLRAQTRPAVKDAAQQRRRRS